jgi:hypothetical protein
VSFQLCRNDHFLSLSVRLLIRILLERIYSVVFLLSAAALLRLSLLLVLLWEVSGAEELPLSGAEESS